MGTSSEGQNRDVGMSATFFAIVLRKADNAKTSLLARTPCIRRVHLEEAYTWKRLSPIGL